MKRAELNRTTRRCGRRSPSGVAGCGSAQARPIRVYGASGAIYFGGQTEDISATGLRIELPASAQVHPGNVVSIHVGLKP